MRAMAVFDRLGVLVEAGAGVDRIGAALAEMLGRKVVVTDSSLRPIVGTLGWSGEPEHSEDGRLQALLDSIAGAESAESIPWTGAPLAVPVTFGAGGPWVVSPISLGSKVLGYLFMAEGEASGDPKDAWELDLLTARHAAAICALALVQHSRAAELTARFKRDLLEALLLGNVNGEADFLESATLVGIDPTVAYRLAVLVPEDDGPNRQRMLELVVSSLDDRTPGMVAMARGDEAIALLPEGSERDGGRTLKELLGRLSARPGSTPLTVGLGERMSELTDLPSSYKRTRRTLDIARRLGRFGQVVSYDELGVYRLLARVDDQGELGAFIEEIIGPLIRYDLRHRSDLVATLASYLAHHGSPSHAARELIVHTNTVTYRLRRIEELTGLSMDDPDDRLAAHLALKALEALGRPRVT